MFRFFKITFLTFLAFIPLSAFCLGVAIVERDTEWVAKERKAKLEFGAEAYRLSINAGKPKYKARIDRSTSELEYEIFIQRVKVQTLTYKVLGNKMEYIVSLR